MLYRSSKSVVWASAYLFLFTCNLSAAQYSVTEVVALANGVKCFHAQKGWIVDTTGPCEEYSRPSRIVIGAPFTANGKRRTIEAITAMQLSDDMELPNGITLRKGQWACSAGETQGDVNPDSGQNDRLWLLIAPCSPVN